METVNNDQFPLPTVGPQTSATLENDNPEMMSEDMRRDLLRQKWEEEEEENLKKTKLHYRDVLYDEARTHGAAFYNFSRFVQSETEGARAPTIFGTTKTSPFLSNVQSKVCRSCS